MADALTAEEEARERVMTALSSDWARVWATLDAARAERDAAEHRCYRLSAPIAADELAALRALADAISPGDWYDEMPAHITAALAAVRAAQGPR